MWCISWDWHIIIELMSAQRHVLAHHKRSIWVCPSGLTHRKARVSEDQQSCDTILSWRLDLQNLECQIRLTERCWHHRYEDLVMLDSCIGKGTSEEINRRRALKLSLWILSEDFAFDSHGHRWNHSYLQRIEHRSCQVCSRRKYGHSRGSKQTVEMFVMNEIVQFYIFDVPLIVRAHIPNLRTPECMYHSDS